MADEQIRFSQDNLDGMPEIPGLDLLSNDDILSFQQKTGIDLTDSTRADVSAAGNLIQSGSTGDPSLDIATSAMAKSQAAFMKGGPEAVYAQIQSEQIPALKQEMMEQYKASLEGGEMTSQQVLAAAILQIAPIIIGAALGGRKGAGKGAIAGAEGGLTVVKGALADNERRQKWAGLAYAEKAGELKAARKTAADYQKMGITQDFQREQNRERNEARIAAGAASSRGLEAFAKQMRNDEMSRLVPVPPKLQDELGETAPAFTVEKALQRKLEEKKLSPPGKPMTEDTAITLGAEKVAKEKLDEIRLEWSKVSSRSKNALIQATGLLTDKAKANIPLVPTSEKVFNNKAQTLSRIIGKQLDPKGVFTDEDAAFWGGRLPIAGTDSGEIGDAKLADLQSLLDELLSAKKVALEKSGRAGIGYATASPIAPDRLMEVAKKAKSGDLIAAQGRRGQVNIYQIFNRDGKLSFDLINTRE